MILEICANSLQSAINAQEAGAQRIELCSELAIGGITPSYGLIKAVMDLVSIPVYVLIRPRSGNFTFSQGEFEIMKHNINLCKHLGCAGIVSGVLNNDNSIDVERTRGLIELSRPLAFTFHRAFDWTPRPFEAIKLLKDLGVDKVLTSGQESSAVKGIGMLQRLKEVVKNGCIILPGGGVNPENASLFKDAGFFEIHASATTVFAVNEIPNIGMNSPKFFDETIAVISDEKKIKAILSTFKDAES